MKLTADQYCYVYFCTLEEPAMFKPLIFVSIRQPRDIQLMQALSQTYEQAVQMYLCQGFLYFI